MRASMRVIRWSHVGLGAISRCLHRMTLWGVFPALLCLVLLDVSLRASGASTLSWSHELLGVLLLLLFCCQLPHSVAEQDLIRMDLLSRVKLPWLQSFMQGLSFLLTFIVSVLIAWQGGISAVEMFHYEERAYTIDLPLWPVAALIGLSGVLMALNVCVSALFACTPSGTGRPCRAKEP